MGWAIPAAIGAQRVRPDRQVVCVTGDGCFLMSAMEMSTAARAGLPVKFFVFDDGAYHYMQMLQEPRLPPDHRHRDRPDRLRRLRPGRRPGLQPDRLQRRRPARASSARWAWPARSSPACMVSYEGREIRWLSALRSHYIDSLSNRQKVRLAARIGVRSRLAPGRQRLRNQSPLLTRATGFEVPREVRGLARWHEHRAASASCRPI